MTKQYSPTTTSDKSIVLAEYLQKLATSLKRGSRTALATSHLALAFVFGILIQIKLQGQIDRSFLAGVAIATLLLAVLAGYLSQVLLKTRLLRNDIFQWFLGLSEHIEETINLIPEDEKRVKARQAYLDESLKNEEEFPFIPYWPILIQWVLLGAGVVISAIYFWLYLFTT